MNKLLYGFFIFILICPQVLCQYNYILVDQYPMGFASVNTLGFNGTTGGKGGDTVICQKGQDISTLIGTTPRVVLVKDTVICSQIKGKNNFSILGVGKYAAVKGIPLSNVQNVIIRNLNVFDSPDGLSITTASSSASHHIWIDHCTLTDSPAVDFSSQSHDGLMDITHRSSWITVSWCHFNNHRKTCLLGYSASGGSGETEPNQLMVTS